MEELPENIVDSAVQLERQAAKLRSVLEGMLHDYTERDISEEEKTELDEARLALVSLVNHVDSVLQSIDSTELIIQQEDEELGDEEMYGIARRFVERKNGVDFTLADLQAHLRRNHAPVPKDEATFSEIFKNWQDEIKADKEEAGEKVLWMQGSRQGQPWYALAEVWTGSSPPAVRSPESAVKSARPSPETQTEHEAEKLNGMLAFVKANMSEKAHKVVALYAEAELEGDVPAAAALIEQLLQNGSLHTERVEGTKYFSETPPNRAPTTYAAEHTKKPEHFTDIDAARLDKIMQLLGSSTASKNSGFTNRELLAQLADPECSENELKRLLAMLRKEGKAESRRKSRVSKATPRTIVPLATRKGYGSPESREQTIRAIRTRYES